MKLSKQQETEIIRAYKVYFDSYINGDVKTVVSLLDDNYNQIGSAETEVFFNREDATKFLHDTIDQVAGKTEMRNRFIKVDPLEDLILVTDLFDIYALMDSEWSFYAKFRASTLMQKKEDGWKFIHQHSSMPDTRTEDGENIAIEKVNAENLQLREAVKRRTIELEQKTRDLEIEGSLERVRARSMAMHKSEELAELSLELVKQVQALGVATWFCAFNIYDEDTKGSLEWGSNGQGTFPKYRTPREGIFLRYYEAGQKGETLLINEIDENECPKHYDYLCSLPGVGEQLLKMKGAGISFPTSQIDHVAFFKYGYILFITFEPAPEAHAIFKRFAKVFEQTYTRFLDLQKAEAQAREAQIELSLERIRAQVTAMKESSDLLDIVVTMNGEFNALGHEAHYFWHMRWLPDSYEKAMTSGDGSRIGMVMELPRGFHENAAMNEWEENTEPSIVVPFDVEGAIDYVDKMIRLGRFSEIDHNAPGPDDIRAIGGLTFVMARTTHGEIGYSLPGVVANPPTEDLATLVRFAGVFDLAYRRFEDIKDAERRNREAQIELALERSRTQSMLMQHSDELGKTARVFHEQLQLLGIDSEFSYLWLPEEAKNEHLFWATWNENNNGSTIYKNKAVTYPLDKTETSIAACYLAWKSGELVHVNPVAPNEVENYFATWEELLHEVDKFKPELFPDGIYYVDAYMKYGCFGIVIKRLITEDEKIILSRFSIEFERAYTRFLDLQKAEEQTREAKIEASLERIRSQAMAMQHSNDLVKSTAILFEEFEKLELSVDRCGIGIFDEETRDCQLWTTVVTHEGETELATGITSLTVHPMLIETFEAWKSQRSLQYILEGKELEDYYALVSKSEFHLPSEVVENSASLPKEYYLYTPFGAGGLYVFSAMEPAKEEKSIIRRFAEVFHMTYTRYEDLQKAEARAIEAVKQASLDRVRGEIASMRTTEDLQRITPLIWSELEILEVPFNRCGVFILDEIKTNVQVYLTAPDGKPLGALNLPFDANELTIKTVEYWRKKNVYTHHWNKEDFITWMESMISMGQIQIRETYKGDTKPPESLDLHFIPFMQGMLYVGNSEPLLPEKIELVKTLAEAFSIAYARYEDFIHLEEAKNQIENTLTELKLTQGQLIHAEKMASLGELTAGIAHEIQNPLNFVNNFSEVSVDLLDEMAEELIAGNTEEVNAIGEDLKQNLEKITVHGKRASFIVKGMLEHSRTNAGEKKPTDINVLADEFLRLSYHGLRAKDKSFNAEIITEFDDELPEISVIAQDFGRVLLNLVNNAFYAVAEKQRLQKENYKPTVLVSTQKIGDTVEIRVKDNGSGIPDDIVKKIFQPFFTTKPTGEGTGLGLSMSYDIITKGHQGDLRVDTKEGEGTEFIIVLPEN